MDTIVPEIIRWSDAKRAGRTRYFTGVPCVYGHVTERLVNGKKCVECARIRRKEHHDLNKESRRAYSKAYYAANAEAIKAARRQYAKDNPEKERAYAKKWYAENPEKAAAQVQRDRAKNGPARNESTRKWRARNIPKQNAYSAKRHAMTRVNTPEVREDLLPIFQAEILAIYAEARTLTELTGNAYHVDHIFPLSKGGAHAPWNLRVLLGFDNQSKKDKWPKGEPTHVMWHGEIVSRLVGKLETK